jgi:hypothetical protein
VFFCALCGSAHNRAVRFDSILLVLPKQKKCSASSARTTIFSIQDPQSNPVAEQQCDSARFSSSTGLRASPTVLNM